MRCRTAAAGQQPPQQAVINSHRPGNEAPTQVILVSSSAGRISMNDDALQEERPTFLRSPIAYHVPKPETTTQLFSLSQLH